MYKGHNFKYNGLALKIWEESDFDSKVYLYHIVYNQDGVEVGRVDWSSYGESITEDDFKLWVDLDMPTRDHPAINQGRISTPLSAEKLKKIKEYTIKGL